MSAKRVQKDMVFHGTQKEPAFHQTSDSSQVLAHFLLYDMFVQINDPGTIDPKVSTGTALVGKCLYQFIVCFYEPADICQQNEQQNDDTG